MIRVDPAKDFHISSLLQNRFLSRHNSIMSRNPDNIRTHSRFDYSRRSREFFWTRSTWTSCQAAFNSGPFQSRSAISDLSVLGRNFPIVLQ